MMPLTEARSDQGLLTRMNRGDSSAFTELYRRHQPPVYRFALLWAGSESIAADVTQEVFLALMRQKLAFDGTRGTLGAFLCGVARNLVRQHTHRGKAWLAYSAETDTDELLPDALVDASSPMEKLLLKEELSVLRRSILRLPPRYRDVLVLCELQEMSYAETAMICGCELGTVRSRLSRARALLAAAMKTSNFTGSESTHNSSQARRYEL